MVAYSDSIQSFNKPKMSSFFRMDFHKAMQIPVKFTYKLPMNNACMADKQIIKKQKRSREKNPWWNCALPLVRIHLEGAISISKALGKPHEYRNAYSWWAPCMCHTRGQTRDDIFTFFLLYP